MFRKFLKKKTKTIKQRQFLVYKNRFDEVKPYEVKLLFSNAETLEVFDIVDAKDKTFLKKNILGEFNSFAEAKHHSEEKQKDFTIRTPVKIGTNMGNQSNKSELCFTGFKKNEKAELISIAEKNGFFIRSDVSKGLTALICGDNAGPSKMKRAQSVGAAIIVGKAAYLMFLETGELN